MREKRKEKEKKTQWHPAFCSAIKLELVANKNDLEYNSEYGINTKPIQIDLLIIKKMQNVPVENDIGRIFRIHNIVEYKSPRDELNIDTFFKVMAYACLYKSKGKTVDAIKLEEITMTFIRKSKPRKLFEVLNKYGMTIEENKNGIYYVYADSVLQVAMQRNKEVFGRIKEADSMCEALMELMKPEFDAALKKQVAIEVEAQVKEQVEAKVKEQVEAKVKEQIDAQVAKATADKDAKIKELEAKLAAAGIE